jgi:hypothetical protein
MRYVFYIGELLFYVLGAAFDILYGHRYQIHVK